MFVMNESMMLVFARLAANSSDFHSSFYVYLLLSRFYASCALGSNCSQVSEVESPRAPLLIGRGATGHVGAVSG